MVTSDNVLSICEPHMLLLEAKRFKFEQIVDMFKYKPEDNAPPHKAKLVQDTVKALGWEFHRIPQTPSFIFIDETIVT